MRYELIIAHRVCPALANTAVRFTDKLEMVRVTTSSLAKALNGIRTKLIVILDGCAIEYERLFDDVFKGKMANLDYERISTPAIGNHATYAKQLELLTPFADEAEYLYFSEDDYIYREDAFLAMMDFLKSQDVDFVTPLDHPDRYANVVPGKKEVEVRVSDYCHWREVGTTCCTFMTKRDIFKKAQGRLACYGNGGCDGTLWLGLTKDGLFDFFGIAFRLLRFLLGKDRNWAKCLAVSAWKFHGLKLLFCRRYRLWGPIPTLAVHLAAPSVPPLSKELMKKGQCENHDCMA